MTTVVTRLAMHEGPNAAYGMPKLREFVRRAQRSLPFPHAVACLTDSPRHVARCGVVPLPLDAPVPADAVFYDLDALMPG